MESHPYSYGTKLTGLILHLFFTVVLTIAVFLLASMLSKNIFELSDVGTEQFLDSGYYTKCIEKKCDDLSDYLRLLIKGESRTSEENRRYLQYTNEFKSGDSNFCYWYRIGEAWYTNQPDTKEGQEFDVEAVLMEAKTMGNYLIYDLVDKEFGTDINGMADYFFGGGNQMLWPADDMTLIIGIDTELSAEDDIYEASREYEQLHPWIKVCTFSGLVSLMGWIISLVYLTLATGRRTGEEKIHLNPIDKIKTEILVAAFIFMMVELVILITKVNSEEWDHCSIRNRESCDRRFIPDLLSEHGAQNESGDALGDKRCVLARKRYPQSICQTENNGACAAAFCRTHGCLLHIGGRCILLSEHDCTGAAALIFSGRVLHDSAKGSGAISDPAGCGENQGRSAFREN